RAAATIEHADDGHLPAQRIAGERAPVVGDRTKRGHLPGHGRRRRHLPEARTDRQNEPQTKDRAVKPGVLPDGPARPRIGQHGVPRGGGADGATGSPARARRSFSFLRSRQWSASARYALPQAFFTGFVRLRFTQSEYPKRASALVFGSTSHSAV